VGRGSTVEEHDASGGNKFCAGTHYLLVWVPQTLTIDQGPSFMSHQFREFMESLKIKLLNSSPYYVQANGQAEASNKVLIKIIKKRIKDNSRKWHEKLSEALWAHRISRHRATKVTPFELVYGQEVVLPVEVGLQNLRITGQDYLSAKEYIELMMDKVDKAPESQLKALEEIEKGKVKISKAYNKRVVEKSFQVGDLVWKMILPLGTRSGKFGKWSPSWEGPFRVIRVLSGNAYFMEDLEGHSLPKALNRKYLKHYYLACGKTDMGDYRIKVDWWNRESWTVKGNRLV
jgi:hypothetical protein